MPCLNRGGSRRRRDRISICVVENECLRAMVRPNWRYTGIRNTDFNAKSVGVCLYYVRLTIDRGGGQEGVGHRRSGLITYPTPLASIITTIWSSFNQPSPVQHIPYQMSASRPKSSRVIQKPRGISALAARIPTSTKQQPSAGGKRKAPTPATHKGVCSISSRSLILLRY